MIQKDKGAKLFVKSDLILSKYARILPELGSHYNKADVQTEISKLHQILLTDEVNQRELTIKDVIRQAFYY